MFEEDFERCFICQSPCKGLYCSSECRQQDKGTPSPAIKAAHAPARLTAQLPVSLSPLVRPSHHISPSPTFAARQNGTSSSSSSISESPIHSPQTNPSASDSPQKEAFNLPPPAFPSHPTFGFLGSMPVKIPSLVPRLSTQTPTPIHSGAATPGSHTTAYPVNGASIDTLRFGRKSSVTNSVTSPNALMPRCGCGRPLGHRARSKERPDDSAISRLTLGPAVTANADDLNTHMRTLRIVSEPALPRATTGGHTTPAPCPEDRSIANVLGSSLLSRSRSDPIPPSPRGATRDLALTARPAPISPSSSRVATMATVTPPVQNVALPGAGAVPSISRPMRATPPARPAVVVAVSPVASPRRGRSRERMGPRVEMTPDLVPALLLHHEEREVAPNRSSRSRHRMDERETRLQSKERRERSRDAQRELERERERQRDRDGHRPAYVDPPQITPSWSRRPTPAADAVVGNAGNVVPQTRRSTGGAPLPTNGKSSPKSPRSPVEERGRGGRVYA